MTIKVRILNPFVEEDLKQILENMQQRKKQPIDLDGENIKMPNPFENIPDPEEVVKEKERKPKPPLTKTKPEEAISLGEAIGIVKEAMKPETTEDIVNKPSHYHHGGFDVYEWMQDKFSIEEYRGFCIGNIEKYLQRHKLKNDPAENLEKLRFNVDRLIESYRGIKYVPEHKKTQEEWDI